MGTTLKRRGWYDGWFYAWFIDSDFTSFRNRIFKYIEPDKRLIDIGCGTGGFTMKLARKSKYTLGVDISGKQIQLAKRRLMRSKMENLDFKHINATNLSQQINEKFDYAILTFVLHEVNQEERTKILSEVKEIAHKVIILYYHYPMARNFSGFVVRLTEFFAGSEHFKNFLDYNSRGGLSPLLKETELNTLQDRINNPRVFRTVVAADGITTNA